MQNSLYYFFEDEYADLIENYKTLDANLQAEYARKGEAAGQTGNSRHDNFDYEDAERTINMLAPRVNKMKAILSQVKIFGFEILSQKNDKIVLGSKVEYLLGDTRYTSVIGGYNTRIEGRIAYNSPLGQALLHKKIGDFFSFSVGKEKEKGKSGSWGNF